ncbi:MAG TPA: hypothetical protein VF898_04605 [Chloroflexota bacterium]
MRIIEQFCDAYAEWDERSNVGDVYLTPIMQDLGGHIRRGNDPDELGEYEVENMRDELLYLTREIHMDAAFLVASLIRAIDAELIATSEAYGETLETLTQKRAAMEQIFEQYGGPVPEHALQSMKNTLDSVWALHEEPSDAPRRDQQRITDWRDIMAPIIDRDNLERAYTEQWGEPEE